MLFPTASSLALRAEDHILPRPYMGRIAQHGKFLLDVVDRSNGTFRRVRADVRFTPQTGPR